MKAILLVAALYEHEAGKLTDEEETALFRALVACPELWPHKLNDAFRARVLTKLKKLNS